MAAALQPTTGRSQPQASASADLSRYRRPEPCPPWGHSPAILSRQQHSLQHLRSSAASHRQRAGLRFCCHAPAHPFSHGFREAHTALQAQAGARHEPRLWGQPPASRSASAVRSMQQEQEADGIAQEGADEVAEEGEDEGGYPSDSGDDGVLIFGEAPEARKLRRFDGKVCCRVIHPGLATPFLAASERGAEEMTSYVLLAGCWVVPIRAPCGGTWMRHPFVSQHKGPLTHSGVSKPQDPAESEWLQSCRRPGCQSCSTFGAVAMLAVARAGALTGRGVWVPCSGASGTR